MHDILAVKDALLRKGIVVDPACSVCRESPETMKHLFSRCSSNGLWRALHWGLILKWVGLWQWGADSRVA